MGEKRKDSKGRILKEGERQRGNFYEFRYSVHGIRKNFYASTLDELREKEKELIKDQLDGTRANARNITLNNLYDIWRKNKKGLRGNTFQNYTYMYEKFVQDELGRYKIRELRRSDIKAFYNSLAENGMKANTVDVVHTVVHQILEMAIDDDYIRYNPADRALTELRRTPEFASKKRKGLTIEEETTLLNYLKNSKVHNVWYPLVLFMLRTGLRVGEVCGLQWDDIDLEKGFLYVRNNLVYYDKGKNVKCGYEMHSTKTDAGTRRVYLIEDAKKALELEKQKQEKLGLVCRSTIDGFNNFVFLNRFGNVYNFGTINKALHCIIKKCNEELLVKNKNSNVKLLPKISSHIFRHTFATRINESGMNDKIRMSSLGHTDISITNEIYTDASDEMIKSEFNKFDDYLKNIERPQVTTEVATYLIH